MKKIAYLSLLTSCLISLGACEGSEYDLENQVPEKFHKILYLSISGKQEVTLYNTDEDNTYSFSVIKAGSDPTLNATADITVLTQEEVDRQYSDLEGVNYKVIGSNAYSLDKTQLNFSAEDDYQLVNLFLKPREVMTAIESNPSAVWVLPIYINSENDSINVNKNQLFLQLKEVVTPTIGFEDSYVNVKAYTYGLVSTISEKIPFKLDTSNKWDIECGFVVDNEYISQYNSANGTIFQELPENSYSFANSMTLPNGTTETNLAIEVKGEQLEPGDYMLPIRINNVSQFEISSTNALYPMAIRIMGTLLDRTGWTAEANTVEETGELGQNSGPADRVLDGDLKTYWHSIWSNGQYHDLPHELIIDAQKEHTFTQFALVQREGSNYVKAGKFLISSDKEHWETVGSFSLKQESGSQVFGIIPTKGRYFKVLITESYSGTNSALAEVYAYGLK
ncbi:DUF1735 domain-containing protein [uncultured Bacteroides sp.]|uniref:BT_3987 domain-containing protein n=1 Tax=uncultured Bacteroides sp. TaxID=162156 RepID=UPI0026746E27|nr:DUF1735 domain-containing protein [uncultured Bacteroides sp.]